MMRSLQFVFFHGKRHPSEMGEPEGRDFLTHLVTDREVAVSTQKQAFNALIFDSFGAASVGLRPSYR